MATIAATTWEAAVHAANEGKYVHLPASVVLEIQGRLDQLKAHLVDVDPPCEFCKECCNNHPFNCPYSAG